MAQMWPPPKPKLGQDEFDEAVQTNMSDFEMSPEEAIKSACEEFTMQGYDLKDIVKKVGGGNTESHALTEASHALDDSLEAEGAEEGPILAIERFKGALEAGAADPLELNAVALKVKAFVPVFIACQKLSAAFLKASTSGSTTVTSLRSGFLLSLDLTRRVMALSVEARDLFDAMKGGAVVVGLLKDHEGDVEILVELVGLAEVAALKEEKNKESLFLADFGAAALGLLRGAVDRRVSAVGASSSSSTVTGHPGDDKDNADLALIRGCCNALTSLVTADDDRPAGSAAFKNARVLAKEGGASKALMHLLRSSVMSPSTESGGGHAGTACAALIAVRQFAANDEICREFADDGGVLAVAATLDAGAWLLHPTVVKAALGALRQMSSSDSVKTLLAERGGIEKILGIMSVYPSTDNVLEPALGLLTSMMLRLPDIALKAADAGAIDAIVEVMSSRPAAAQLQRSGCMALRNMVARTPELRPIILDKGAEPLLRGAQKRHSSTCQDVGAAALRDLGLSDYGTTLVSS